MNYSERLVSPTSNPLNEVGAGLRDIELKDADGKVIFSQKGVTCPKSWSDLACRVATHKYFLGNVGDPNREDSIISLIKRVSETVTRWGVDQEYFNEEDSKNFKADLDYILVNQIAAFNTPVWINLGAKRQPQVSACFITSLEDHLSSIKRMYSVEMDMFRRGSGNGCNLSSLRSAGEPLREGGHASGPLPFMKGLDFSCGAMKSGGVARRGALMRILNINHPDILEFVKLKQKAEGIATTLIEAGFDSNWDTGIYKNLPWQNSNNSVRVTDKFMRTLVAGTPWELEGVTTDEKLAVSAKGLWEDICEAAWSCGDPGLQFHDTINKWNPCRTDGEINASNPCSEYMFLDDTSCNLASINLVKFMDEKEWFNIGKFESVVKVMILAMDILVSKAYYPDPIIDEKTNHFRPLGLGYSNLGSLLMRSGVPYDSDQGRSIAASVTALMHSVAVSQSVAIAEYLGDFVAYSRNSSHVEEVLTLHWYALDNMPYATEYPHSKTERTLDLMNTYSEELLCKSIGKPIRNAQLTCLAPCGTIGLLMDCDTTGIEPELALVKEKQLVGGSVERIVNTSVNSALKVLGYGEALTKETLANVEREGKVDGSGIKPEDYPVFATALDPERPISWQGHILMMAVVQPFLSGAISKTVSMPRESTVEDVETAFKTAYKEGLKAITIYRDGSKGSQPVTIPGGKLVKPIKRELPQERNSKTTKLSVGGFTTYLTRGFYEDGSLGEIWIRLAKSGSAMKGLYDLFSIAVSTALQWGVPLEVFVRKFRHQKFDPSGPVKLPGQERVKFYSSIIDCVFDYLAIKHLNEEVQEEIEEKEEPDHSPFCSVCGSLMIRSGTCFKCTECGATSGCS